MRNKFVFAGLSRLEALTVNVSKLLEIHRVSKVKDLRGLLRGPRCEPWCIDCISSHGPISAGLIRVTRGRSRYDLSLSTFDLSLG